MTEVLLFHHALGLTAGVRAFADELQAAGHAVALPDLYDGATYETTADGVAHAERVGFDVIADRGVAHADRLGDRLVVAGFSLGVLPAQKLAQTRQGVVGAVLYHSAAPPAMFGGDWPAGVGLQMHFTEDDPWAEEDLEVARALAAEAGGELFVYPGSGHLVADRSSTDYAPDIAVQILQRTLEFLDAHG